jgi:NAD(P)-dependent dehydrogenase (short-subunit alcohol dehydrogenase family)
MRPDEPPASLPTDFSSRRVAVTGAGGGIGRAAAELLQARGAAVVACDRSEPSLAPLADAGMETVAADLSSIAGRDALVAATGECDHLVVAHGIVRPKPIAETTEDDWDAIVGVNAKAVYFLCQGFGRLLRDDGSIVTVSSVSARSAASLEQSVYCASKAAVGSITRSFAHAYAARGIRVNSVLPGIIDTPMQEAFLESVARNRGTTAEAVHESRLAAVPLARTAPPSECAEAILWLLSPAARYMTGQQIAVDGGLTMF